VEFLEFLVRLMFVKYGTSEHAKLSVIEKLKFMLDSVLKVISMDRLEEPP
jgi:hypothetical protein